ncbi:hypothetical protein ACFY7C_36850 [Streptomyces sp. NPDC012769]|uniref:hypothetical protein n=1 Tax=Streptomyces sp. NPDC012769 TaxID=3364848 RepID=UPI0036890ECC
MAGKRHPSVESVTRFFEYEHLPADLKVIAAACSDLKDFMLLKLEDDPEFTVGLRKLLEAKDCFVRASVAQKNRNNGKPEGKPIS